MRTFLLLAICTTAALQATQAQSPRYNIGDFSFMKGKWHVDHPWGYMEEYWGEPIGDNMISSYRCVKDGKIVFYEFVVIEQTDSVPVMILRHFKPGSIAWEDKTTPNHYPLVSIGHNKAVFRNESGSITLTYELKSPNALDVTLVEKNEPTVFNYTRAENP